MCTHRYIARLELEAETPLFVGSGDASLLKDAVIQTDASGYPMILGTSLAGVLRHAFASESWCDRFFGRSNSNNGDSGGSLLKVSSAYLKLSNNAVAEGIILANDSSLDEAIERYQNLPSRQHVSISPKGVAEQNKLYDNEVVYKGTRFVFELELVGEESDGKHWDDLLAFIKSPVFRVGAGTRKGYGAMRVVGMFEKVFNLQDSNELDEYLAFDPSFNGDIQIKPYEAEGKLPSESDFITYRLDLEPESFFLFSEGFGDAEVDNKPVQEDTVTYTDDRVVFSKQNLIPASSVKGAISHRTAFHYNKLVGGWADSGKGDTGVANAAVKYLFGAAGEGVAEKSAGGVFLNDWYYDADKVNNDKIFNHVAIDRFTGGAIDGALFSEKVFHLVSGRFAFNVYVKRNSEEFPEHVLEAFEEALIDVAKGLLPLGGMTTKGNGIFTGSVAKNGHVIFYYH